MKYIKKYENKIIPYEFTKGLEDFFKSYDIYDNRLKVLQKQDFKNFFKLPDFILDEYCMLNYYYNQKRKWITDYKDVNNYIKKEVKKLTLNNIVNKIIEFPDNYTILIDYLEYIKKNRYTNHNQTLLYFYFLLEDVLDKVPNYIKKSIKYNL